MFLEYSIFISVVSVVICDFKAAMIRWILKFSWADYQQLQGKSL